MLATLLPEIATHLIPSSPSTVQTVYTFEWDTAATGQVSNSGQDLLCAGKVRSPVSQSLLALKFLYSLLRQLAGRAQRAGRWTAQQRPQGRPAGFPLAPRLRKQTTAAVSQHLNPAVITILFGISSWRDTWLLLHG